MLSEKNTHLKKPPREATKENTPKELPNHKCLTCSQKTFQRKHTMALPTCSQWNILFSKAVLQQGCFLLVRLTGILKTPFLKSVSIAQTGLKKEGRYSNISPVKCCLGSFQAVVQEWCRYSTSDSISPWAHAFASLILLRFA